MTDNPRRSTRIAKHSETPKKAAAVTYEAGHGLVVAKDDGFQLCVVQKATKSSAQSIPITWLESTNNELKYKEGSNGKCQSKVIITEFTYKKQRGLFTLTKAQLQAIKDEMKDSEPEDNEESEESEDFSEEEPAVAVKRKRATPAKAPQKKAKTGKPVVFKKGVYNPRMPDPPVDTQLMWDPAPQPFLGPSLSANNKNFHRAVATGNKALLKNLLATKGQVSRLNDYWSPDFQFTPLMIAICKGDEDFIRELVAALKNHKIKRGYEPAPALTTVGTGHVSDQTFGVRVRQVNMSRGAREGNNAFLMDQLRLAETAEAILQNDTLKRMIMRGLEPHTLNLLHTLVPSFENRVSMLIGEAVRSGNVEMALHLIKWFNKRGGFGLNALHEEVLKKGKLTPFKKPSITKKPIENYLVAPLHVACINPDTKHLEEILAMCDDIGYPDLSGRRTIHYAAACTSDAPVKVLKNHGVNVNECDKQKFTPLMISAIYNRPAPAAEIIKTVANISFKSREGMAAIHYAAMHGSLDTLDVLVRCGAVVDQPGAEGRTPLMYAAMQGHFDCLEYLLQAGAKVNKRDRRRRTALLFAVKNGFAKEACFLLRHGADYDDPDSSKNYPLHYAAAYGWVQCIDLLVMAGANINCVNDWKLQPLLVAMLKGQTECVSRLLREPDIDVNCKDDEGRTLLSQAMGALSEETLNQIQFLIQEKQADPNIPNIKGMAPLHFLASQPKPVCHSHELTPEERKQWEDEAMQRQIAALSLLIEKGGANVNAPCNLGKTPIYYALESKNLALVQDLIRFGADLTVQRTDGGGILHSICALDHDFFDVFRGILKDPNVVQACIHLEDAEGFNPFLAFIRFFVSNASSAHQEIHRRIQTQMQQEIADKMELENAKKTVRKRSSKRGKQDDDDQEDDDQEDDDQEENGQEEEDDEEEEVPQPKKARPARQKRVRSKFGLRGGARTKQTARKSFGKAPRKMMAMKAMPKQALKSGLRNYVETSANLNIDYQVLNRRTEEEFENLVGDFIEVLKELVNQGCNCHAVVQKLKKYRDNPELIHQEQESGSAVGSQPAFNNSLFGNPFGNSPAQVDRFIIDSDGNKHWKEYNEQGLQNALHLMVGFHQETLLNYLLSLGIDVNQQDFYGFTPLARFLSQNSGHSQIMSLLTNGADPNLYNYQRKAPIHFAVASTYSVTQLVQYNTKLDVLSTTNEAPLHIAVTNKNLEVIRVLCTAGADPNFRNNHQRTPLHLAFNGADCSADASFELESLLLYYGADINAVDVRNRTPLHYAFVKIGRHRDMSQIDPIETVSSACSRSAINVNIQDNWGKTPLHYAAQRGALTSTMFMLSKGSELDLEDEEGNTALALAFKNMHANYAIMLMQKGASIHKPVKVASDPEQQNQRGQQGLFGSSWNQRYGYQNYSQSTQLPEGVHSMFKAAVILGWQGAAYLVLFNGYDYMRAMEDAMNEGKFQLVRTLLAKVSDDSVLTQLNDRQQSLFHTLAIKAQNVDHTVMSSICQQLSDRGVQVDSPDENLRTPLHYSMNNQNAQLSTFLMQKGARLDAVDVDSDTPLSLVLKGEKILRAQHLLQSALGYGASLHFAYTQDGVTLTPLLNCILHRGPAELIKFFLDHSGTTNDVDSLGRNALMYAIVNNDSDMVTALIHEKDLNLEHTDSNGCTALHYVVQPLEYGSYENTQILKTLLKKGVNPSPVDNQGRTPYYFACQQRSGRMKAELEKVGVDEEFEVDDALSVYERPEVGVPDFEEHAEEYIKAQPNFEHIHKIERGPDEQAGGFGPTYSVVEDFDLYMTKVDLSYGPFSAYLFYRMQVLHESNRDVYVLVNRWGRIGEVGAYQRTPFNNKDEAVNEFKKIFRMKSGNEWGQTFKQVRGKYRMIELQTKRVNYTDFVQRIDLKDAVASQLPEESYASFKIVTRVASYRHYLNNYTSLDNSMLNFSSLSKERLQEAEDLILEIAALNKQLHRVKETTRQIEIKDEIYELCNRYYELVPIRSNSNGPIPPILGDHAIKQAFDQLDSLKNMEIASKMILGALWNRLRTNPVDYLLSCIPVNIAPLDTGDSELTIIKKYIQAGQGSPGSLINAFKLNREGEAERISKFKKLTNRKLLWHGTQTANLVGILCRGLLTPPADLPNVGLMFGKGLYFANMFVKSQGYSGNYCYTDEDGEEVRSYFMFLCEVALGKEKKELRGEQHEKCPSSYQSVLGVGRTIPDPEESLYLNNGIEVPLGKAIQRELKANEYCSLAHDEFIVYNHDQVRLRYLIHMKQ